MQAGVELPLKKRNYDAGQYVGTKLQTSYVDLKPVT